MAAAEQSANVCDWNVLRKRSLLPGGFGDERASLWPTILGVSAEPAWSVGRTSEDHPDGNSDASVEHADERQIKLDTDRSFVLYPVESSEDRDSLQDGLHDLLLAIFRKRRKLNYFQGYHDIITVLYLTLPPEIQLPCAEKLSLHRLRDAMGTGLEPLLGLLRSRVLQNLLVEVDPAYASILESTAPLPYYALSNLLTLFSHDIPTLPLIQHVFDYLLCRPPLASVYLAAAIILCRKEEVKRLEEEGEEGMMHSLLSSLPEIFEEGEDVSPGDDETEAVEDSSPDSAPVKRELTEATAGQNLVEHSSDVKVEDTSGSSTPEAPLLEADLSSIASSEDESPALSTPSEDTSPVPPPPPIDEEKSLVAELQNVPIYMPPPNISPVPKLEEIQPEETVEEEPPRPQKARISLSTLLTHADALYAAHPPSAPALGLRSIMGPQSVVFTWTEDAAQLPDDDEAEAMVLCPELIVRPPPPPEDEGDEGTEKEKEKGKRRRRTLRKPRRRRTIALAGVEVEQRTLVAGAVLVVSVALAVYGARVGPGEQRHQHTMVFRRVGRWASALLLGTREG